MRRPRTCPRQSNAALLLPDGHCTMIARRRIPYCPVLSLSRRRLCSCSFVLANARDSSAATASLRSSHLLRAPATARRALRALVPPPNPSHVIPGSSASRAALSRHPATTASTATPPTPRAKQTASPRLWVMPAALGRPPPTSASRAAWPTARRARAARRAKQAHTRMPREQHHASCARAAPTARRELLRQCHVRRVGSLHRATSLRQQDVPSAHSGMRAHRAPPRLSLARPDDSARSPVKQAAIARAHASKGITA